MWRKIQKVSFISRSVTKMSYDFGNLSIGLDKIPAAFRLPDVDLVKEEIYTKDIEPKTSYFKKNSPYWYLREIKRLIATKQVDEALNVFENQMLADGLPAMHLVKFYLTHIYEDIINALAHNGKIDKAFELFKKMKDYGLTLDDSIYTSLITACSETPDKAIGLEKLNYVRTIMMEKQIPLNKFIYNALIMAYGKCGDLVEAFTLFEIMKNGVFSAELLPYKTLYPKCHIGRDTYIQLFSTCLSDCKNGFLLFLKVWHDMTINMDKKPTLQHYNLLLRSVRDCEIGDINLLANASLKHLSTPLPEPLSKTNQTTLIEHQTSHIDTPIKTFQLQKEMDSYSKGLENLFHEYVQNESKLIEYMLNRQLFDNNTAINKSPHSNNNNTINNINNNININLNNNKNNNNNNKNSNDLTKSSLSTKTYVDNVNICKEPGEINVPSLAEPQEYINFFESNSSFNLLSTSELSVEDKIKEFTNRLNNYLQKSGPNFTSNSTNGALLHKNQTIIKYMMIGGFTGFMAKLNNEKILPNLKTLTLLAEILPATQIYTKALLNIHKFMFDSPENLQKHRDGMRKLALNSSKPYKYKSKKNTDGQLIKAQESNFKPNEHTNPKFAEYLEMANAGVIPLLDADFFLVLIKKYATVYAFDTEETTKQHASRDYPQAIAELIEEMHSRNLTMNVRHFGALALACRNVQMAEQLITDMKELDVKPNIIILGALLSNACHNYDIPYMTYCINYCLSTLSSKSQNSNENTASSENSADKLRYNNSIFPNNIVKSKIEFTSKVIDQALLKRAYMHKFPKSQKFQTTASNTNLAPDFLKSINACYDRMYKLDTKKEDPELLFMQFRKLYRDWLKQSYLLMSIN